MVFHAVHVAGNYFGQCIRHRCNLFLAFENKRGWGIHQFLFALHCDETGVLFIFARGALAHQRTNFNRQCGVNPLLLFCVHYVGGWGFVCEGKPMNFGFSPMANPHGQTFICCMNADAIP